jgi:nicotinate-nucleotide adenylyltransferase
MSTRIGVIGGTFNPVHIGHLILAEQARETLDLDQVRFIPAPRPPHKSKRVLTPYNDRAQMLALAIAGHSAFVLDERERERPGPSYTADTLEELAREFPAAGLYLLLGSDSLTDLANWRDPERIAHLAQVVVMRRPGASPQSPEPAAMLRAPGFQVTPLTNAPLVDVSSRDLRRRAADSRSLRYLVPRAVECYIQMHRLYQTATAGD